MPKPALNNRNNSINVYGRVIAHDLFVNQGVTNNDSPTFANLHLTGDATITGNLYVEGNTSILNSNIIEFEDNIIIINSKETGNGVTLNQAGFEIERGSLENYRFAFRESDFSFRIGLVSNMQTVATREDNPLSNGIMIWNSIDKRLDSKNTINIPTLTFQSTINSLSSSTGSLILAGGIGIKKDIFTDGILYLGGNSYNKRCSIYTNNSSNNLIINSGEEINLNARTNITIPTNVPLVLGDYNKSIKSTPSNNIDITCDGDINFNLSFAKRLIIPNLSSIVFSTDNERIFTDGFNNMVIRCSEDILLQPLTNKKVLLPNEIPIAFNNTSQQIRSNSNNELLVQAGSNITLTPGLSLRINSTVPSNSVTSGGIILSGGMGMLGNLNIGGNLSINGQILKIPTGNNSSRPLNPIQGYIRYNTEYSQFEGFGAGNAWGSLGGVADISQTTKILASASPGITDGNLYFYNVGNESMRINSSGNVSIGTTSNSSSKLYVNGSITTDVLNIINTIESIDTSSGALIVSGGVGISGKLHANEVHFGNTVIGGNLTVSGTTITLQSETQIINDNLLVLNAGPDGIYDAGLMINLTTGSYATMFYDRNTEHFHFAHTSSDPGAASVIVDHYIGIRTYHADIVGTDNATGLGTGGSLTTLGGASIEKDIYVGGVLEISNTTNSYSTGGGSLIVNGGMYLNKNLFIKGDSLQIPSGSSSARPDLPEQGYIRYNTETQQFEGYGAGNAWGSLGGVSDVNQDTKILAEESAGTNDDNLRFFTNGDERMRINSSGNIGIGTTAPSTQLHVNGDIFTTGEVIILSDSRFKTNIETIDNPLTKIQQMRGVYFNKKLENGEVSSRNMGVIAEEVEKVLPEVVHLQNDIKSVAYTNIIGLLIESIKELKSEIDEIKNKD